METLKPLIWGAIPAFLAARFIGGIDWQKAAYVGAATAVVGLIASKMMAQGPAIPAMDAPPVATVPAVAS